LKDRDIKATVSFDGQMQGKMNVYRKAENYGKVWKLKTDIKMLLDSL